MSKNKKRLAIVANNISSFRGGEIFALSLLKKLKQEFDITILNITSKSDIVRITRREIAKKYDLEGVRIVDIASVAVKNKAFGDIDYNFMIPTLGSSSKLVSELGRSDIIYNISSNPAILSLVVFAAKVAGKKLIHGVHNYTVFRVLSEQDGGISSGIYKSVLKNVGYFHTLNSTDFKKVKSGFPGAKAYLIPNFLMFKSSGIYTNKDKFIVIFVGGLSIHEKGLDLLPKIIEKVLSKNDKIIFSIIGSGEGAHLIKEIEGKYKKNVIWHGFLKPEALDKKYAEANLFISTSRFETFQLTVVEAQAHGLPVVSFDAAGPKDIIKKNVQGVCVKNFDTDVFAKQIIRYYGLWEKNKNSYNTNKIKISKNINTIYSYDKITDDIKDMLNDIIKENNKRT